MKDKKNGRFVDVLVLTGTTFDSPEFLLSLLRDLDVVYTVRDEEKT